MLKAKRIVWLTDADRSGWCFEDKEESGSTLLESLLLWWLSTYGTIQQGKVVEGGDLDNFAHQWVLKGVLRSVQCSAPGFQTQKNRKKASSCWVFWERMVGVPPIAFALCWPSLQFVSARLGGAKHAGRERNWARTYAPNGCVANFCTLFRLPVALF